ncbi:hypothetical protein EON73_05125 [bacterium]|nr:MAG: hypothetical protein EON73_05125 [bacterium]
MRKVFLEQNLGKKSKCRFPKKNQKQVIIKLTVEAQKAVSSPSLTQPLVISGVSVIEFCDRFNQETQNFEIGLPIRAVVIVNPASKTFDLHLISPSVFQLIRRVLTTKSTRAQLLNQLIYNISLIKCINQLGSNYYINDLINFIKQTAGNLRSHSVRVHRKIA